MAGLRPSAAEKHLIGQLRLQQKVMERRGIPGEIAKTEICRLEIALRTTHRLLASGGAA